MFTTRPPHGYSPRLLRELGTAELFVLSSLRLWFLAHCDPQNPYPDWRQAFQTAGISTSGGWGFDRLCRIVGSTTRHRLDVHWLQCARVGGYESTLLQVIALIQSDQASAAEKELLQWCPPAAVRLAMEPARAFAVALQEHSLRVPVHETELPTAAIPAPTRVTGSALLH